jgi:hypothetical protein
MFAADTTTVLLAARWGTTLAGGVEMLALTIERERLEPLGGRPRRHRRTRREGRPICLNWN